MLLQDYFKKMAEEIRSDWNVESSLKNFGIGKSNEGTDEAKAIKRYYIEPNDKRFRQIFLNFNDIRNIESIVWFFAKDGKMTLAQLKELFGTFKIYNIIYDDTSELLFTQNMNMYIQYVSTTILEWVEQRSNGTLFYMKENKQIEIDDNYEVGSLIFKIIKKE